MYEHIHNLLWYKEYTDIGFRAIWSIYVYLLYGQDTRPDFDISSSGKAIIHFIHNKFLRNRSSWLKVLRQ